MAGGNATGMATLADDSLQNPEPSYCVTQQSRSGVLMQRSRKLVSKMHETAHSFLHDCQHRKAAFSRGVGEVMHPDALHRKGCQAVGGQGEALSASS